MIKRFKRFCKTLQLENDQFLIEEYKKLHARGKAWPEITQGMKEVGIIDMEIYLSGTTLFMIMDTEENFDHEKGNDKTCSNAASIGMGIGCFQISKNIGVIFGKGKMETP